MLSSCSIFVTEILSSVSPDRIFDESPVSEAKTKLFYPRTHRKIYQVSVGIGKESLLDLIFHQLFPWVFVVRAEFYR